MSADDGKGDAYCDDEVADCVEEAEGANVEVEDEMERANALLRLSCDCRAADTVEESVAAGSTVPRLEKALDAGEARVGSDALREGFDEVATERTRLVCERASARATADGVEEEGNLIVRDRLWRRRYSGV